MTPAPASVPVADDRRALRSAWWGLASVAVTAAVLRRVVSDGDDIGSAFHRLDAGTTVLVGGFLLTVLASLLGRRVGRPRRLLPGPVALVTVALAMTVGAFGSATDAIRNGYTEAPTSWVIADTLRAAAHGALVGAAVGAGAALVVGLVAVALRRVLRRLLPTRTDRCLPTPRALRLVAGGTVTLLVAPVLLAAPAGALIAMHATRDTGPLAPRPAADLRLLRADKALDGGSVTVTTADAPAGVTAVDGQWVADRRSGTRRGFTVRYGGTLQPVSNFADTAAAFEAWTLGSDVTHLWETLAYVLTDVRAAPLTVVSPIGPLVDGRTAAEPATPDPTSCLVGRIDPDRALVLRERHEARTTDDVLPVRWGEGDEPPSTDRSAAAARERVTAWWGLAELPRRAVVCFDGSGRPASLTLTGGRRGPAVVTWTRWGRPDLPVALQETAP